MENIYGPSPGGISIQFRCLAPYPLNDDDVWAIARLLLQLGLTVAINFHHLTVTHNSSAQNPWRCARRREKTQKLWQPFKERIDHFSFLTLWVNQIFILKFPFSASSTNHPSSHFNVSQSTSSLLVHHKLVPGPCCQLIIILQTSSSSSSLALQVL